MELVPLAEHHLAAAALLDRQCAVVPWSAGMFREELALGSCCLALVAPDGSLAGFAVARPQYDEWHIMTLGVAPARRRQGWGERLLRGVVAAASAAGVAALLLEVRASNQPARRLYRKLGFRELAVRRGYYATPGPPEDAVVMTLPLGPVPAGVPPPVPG